MKEQSPHDLLTAVVKPLGSDAVVVSLQGEIDLSSARVLTEVMESVFADGLRNIVIDATAVTFMDSTGLHALVQAKRSIHERGIRIILVPSPQVRRTLELVFPEPLFAARLDTVEEALAALGQVTQEKSSADTSSTGIA
ncbi:MAG TPA: STAS domain-containing protein [Acidimicrobiia bacterium]|nr:STAS domain-containing protein [Acidimicrobiia bacterium]